jgi:hypothetical protein
MVPNESKFRKLNNTFSWPLSKFKMTVKLQLFYLDSEIYKHIKIATVMRRDV